MKFKLIKSEQEYNNAVAYLEELGDREDFQNNEMLIDEFELISKLINIYDSEHYPIESANPIDTILLKMEYMGLKRKDLSHIASSGVLSEVFNGKRALSKQMLREFSELLNIDQSLLNAKCS
jgi:HTH-type transcriptional regulator/antitoxin HigA